MKLFYFRHNQSGGKPEIPPEKICFYELTVVLKGALEYTVDHKEIKVTADDAVFLRQGVTRCRKAFEASDYFSFNFYAEEGDDDFELPVYMEKCAASEIQLLLAACDKIHERSFADDADRLSLLLQCILRQLADNLRARGNDLLTAKIKKYIREHLCEKLTLEKIGRATFFSPVHCSAVFKRETGKSIIDYAIDEKIEEAKRLILEGVELKRIAERLGFSDYNYFSRIFKKRAKYSPAQYKKHIFLK